MKHKSTWPIAATVIIVGCQIHAQICDTNNPVVETFAGSGFHGYLNGDGAQTMFNDPSSVVADSLGNLFVADVGNNRIRKITPGGTVSTYLGGGNGKIPGIGTNVDLTTGFPFPSSIAIDHSDILWLAGGEDVFRATPDGYISKAFTFTNFGGATFGGLSGLCFDSGNNLYCATWSGNQIYRVSTNGTVELFAGSGNFGSVDGNGIFTSFAYPAALAADAADDIYVADAQGQLIRKINQNRDVVTLAGSGRGSDGPGGLASFGDGISTMFVDDVGNLILACVTAIRKMSPTGYVTTLAGSFTLQGYTNGPGSLALFNGASGVCNSGGRIFVADSNNQRIRVITLNSTAQPVPGASLAMNTYPGLTITGAIGRSYQIESSQDTYTWTRESTILLTSSPYLWIDQEASKGRKFYRAWLLP